MMLPHDSDVYDAIIKTVRHVRSRSPFIVCGSSFMACPAYQKLLHTSDITAVPFHDYTPNPTYESVLKGLALFQEHGCDMLISVGGGSPMDVAKSMKAFYGMDQSVSCLQQPIAPNNLVHLAVPTTAGTGSESTHFAVIYCGGKKYSVSHPSLTPDYVILAPQLLDGLPPYQRTATMFDALSHAVESFWSIKSTPRSRRIAAQAIRQFMASYAGYMENRPDGNKGMMEAAHFAGKAIDMTTTTGAHAMSYKLTGLYHIAHGHAVFLCLPVLWRHMLSCIGQTQDLRGPDYVRSSFDAIARLLGCRTPEQAADFIENLGYASGLTKPAQASHRELDELCASVNEERLANNPIKLTAHDIKAIYHSLLFTS